MTGGVGQGRAPGSRAACRTAVVAPLLALLSAAHLLPLAASGPARAAYAIALWVAILGLVADGRSRGLWGALDGRSAFVGLGWGLGLFVLGGLAYWINVALLGLARPDEVAMAATGGLGAVPVLGLVSGAAVLEEFVFRGVILGDGAGSLPGWATVGLSSAAFAAYHLSTYQLLPTSVWGVGFGALTLRTRSLWPATLAHLVVNIAGFAALVASD